MLRIAVVDDELAMREQLCGYVRQYAEENHLAVEVVAFADGAAIAMPYQTGFDIIMLDVDMPLLGGMPTAERIREEDKNVVLMFITNMAQCAIHGYEVDALDFVVKPVSYAPFSMRLARAVKRARRRAAMTVSLQTDDGLKILSVNDILWIETVDHAVICHTKTDSFVVKSSLQNAEKLLQKHGFARCNKCYLVNLRHVQGIQGDAVRVDGVELELSRRQKAAFTQAMLEYVREIR